MQSVLLTTGEILNWVAIGAVGLFAGAMLTEAGLLVPYWQSMEAAEFQRWYRVNAERLIGFFGPLTWAAGLTTLAAAALLLSGGDSAGVAAAIAAGLMLAAVALFPIYFKDANQAFVRGGLSAEELRQALSRWAAWHQVRTALSIGAFFAAVVAAR